MKIGRLNDFYRDIGFRYCFADTVLVPNAEIEGNPVKGTLLQIKWDQIRDEDLALHISLPQESYIDTVVLHFGTKTALNYAKLRVGEQILYTHSAETGNSSKTAVLPLELGTVCKDFTVILSSRFTTLQLEQIELFGATEDGVDLFPTPNAVTVGKETVPVSAFTGCHADSVEGCRAAQLLCEKFTERTGAALSVCDDGSIRFVTDSTLPADGYTLEVSSSGATLCASNLRGFICGVETFIKLWNGTHFPAVQISDSPANRFRGVHLFIPSEDKMDFARRLIKYLISPMGYNVVILQVSGGMIYERHPEISASFAHAVKMRAEGWPAFPHDGIAEGKPITKALLKEYVAYIRSFGIEVIPEVQSLAHVQYLTHAYPEIAEIAPTEIRDNADTTTEDKLPSAFYHHDYCPSNPRSYEILFDVIDEIIEVFEPMQFIHMGHDEVRSIGVCPRCKGKTPAELFAYDVNKIHDYLASKGLRMMMWADMLQPMPKYPTHPAIDSIPKDIVLLDFIWYFHLDKDIEDNLLEKDFPVLFGNLYSSHFPRYESRIRKQGIHGGQISAWVATNEYALQKEGKLYDLFMTAQLLWADSYSRYFRLCYDRMISKAMPQLREDLNGIKYPSRLPGAVSSDIGKNEAAFPPRLPVAQQTEFAVNGQFASLIFRHTALRRITRKPWSELDAVAKYILRYADGSTEEVPVTYGGNLGYWNRRQNAPLAHAFYRHTGYTATYYSDSEVSYTADGDIVTVYIYEYIPKKKLPVVSVTLEQDPAFDAKVFVESIKGIRV